MGTLCLVFVLLHLYFDLSWSFSSSVPPSSSYLCLPDQRDALLEFINTISVDCLYDSDSYRWTESWNKSIDCCSWQGAKCDKLTGHVIGLNLTDSCLTGPLHANSSLFHLNNLQWLDLSSNYYLSGLIFENTSSLFHFPRLQRLNLAYNHFDGTISSELFSQFVSLTHLDLCHNFFSGIIPHQIGLLSSLVSLDLSDSNLRFDSQGFDMLATNLTKLTNLVLDKVDMSDVSITSFLNFTSPLQHLNLRGCQLHGDFPTHGFQLPNLKLIDLGRNQNLRDYLPKTNWSIALELLDLSDCGFRGSIPDVFGTTAKLV